ncbi:MAG TPA: carboxypeptidase regulatory-like domain-containing protein, partial [Thermoanaerobaculia bacterium]|nr:carboxypeptidase regulatory-like domain-containing protein [Thermoanaerobaculia bacterium]
MKRLLLAVLLFALPAAAETITGVVRDDTGAAIPGVTVSAGGSVEVTGMDGTFRITGLKPGAYTVEAVLDGFQPISKPVKLVTGQTIDLSFKLVPAFGETVEVTADAVQTGEVAILESRRQAAVVSDSISSEEIKKTPDSTAAGVVERLTGVTLIGDKYVFVRGLGERYSGTTINGSTLPTTETEKRVVPLDLFPAKLLETVNVVKTYTPDKPGDFGSGLVEMTTTEFPGAAALKVTIGSAYTSGATGSRFRRYAGGLGRSGNGGQAIPSNIPTDILRRRTILDPNGFTAEELQGFGRALAGDWNGSVANAAAPNTDFALTYGNTFGRLGVVLSAVTNHGFDSIEERQSFFGVDAGELVPYNDYALETDRETANSGFVGNLSYRLTDSNRLFLNSVLTRDASAESRFQEGLQSGTGGNIRDYRVRYQLEEVFSSRLRGEHNLGGPGIGSLVDWSVARSTATNDSDLRENVYRETDPGVFALETGYADSGKIEFHALEDEVQQGGAAYSVFFAPEGGRWSGTLKGGVDVMSRTRD